LITIGSRDGSITKLNPVTLSDVVKGMKTYTIIGGEFAVVSDDNFVAFKTLLGSCVSIIFYDKVKKIKGMNHFLLPKATTMNENMKYGLYSVESMLNEMYKKGCTKENIVCKISGGADINKLNNLNGKSIGERNVEFATRFCTTEGFKIISNHIRGIAGRIILVGNKFETFIKDVDNKELSQDVAVYETTLYNELSLQSDNEIERKNKIELF